MSVEIVPIPENSGPLGKYAEIIGKLEEVGMASAVRLERKEFPALRPTNILGSLKWARLHNDERLRVRSTETHMVIWREKKAQGATA